MKKLVIGFVVICVLAVVAVYILIPKILTVGESVKLPCVTSAAFRNLSDGQSWNRWWPGANAGDSTPFSSGSYLFAGNRYTLSHKNVNIFQILIDDKKELLQSELHLLAIPTDSALANWQVNINAGYDPFSRIAAYRKALSLKKDMRSILAGMQTYLSNFKNVYGTVFYEGPVTDTLLITTKSTVAGWPSVNYVYSLINKLKEFCTREGCRITATPMLNVTALYPSGYRVMVALPIDRFIQPKDSPDSISGVKLVGRKFIIVEVTGGEKTVAFMHQQLRFYFQDYRRMLMAIPFDYLITDRQKETDTSKWKTKIFAPVY